MSKDDADFMSALLALLGGGEGERMPTSGSSTGRIGVNHDSAILPEAQIDELRLVAAHYAACLSAETFPFAVGDLVTPEARAGLKGDGSPHIVLEIAPGAAPLWEPTTEAIGSPRQGSRLNLRVLSLVDTTHHGEVMTAHWVEAWLFVPYVEPSGD